MAAAPFEHLERATADPCAGLRPQLLPAEVDGMPPGETFDVTVPTTFTDLGGGTRDRYRESVDSRRAFDAATTVGRSRHVPTERR